MCGATTSGCIRATAIDLLQYGYPTLVPRECVGDRAQAPHEANLFDIQAKYADVVSIEDALGLHRERGPEVRRLGVGSHGRKYARIGERRHSKNFSRSTGDEPDDPASGPAGSGRRA